MVARYYGIVPSTFLLVIQSYHKVRHPRCVYNKLDWSVSTFLTQLYGGRDMYNLLHEDQPQGPKHVVDLCVINYIPLPPYSCARQVYTLQSSLFKAIFIHSVFR